jgi:hypothetical protein
MPVIRTDKGAYYWRRRTAGDMGYTRSGRVLTLAAFGMLCGLLGSEMVAMHDADRVFTIEFFGKSLLHIATVISAFVGGKLLPQPGAMTNGVQSDVEPPRDR